MSARAWLIAGAVAAGVIVISVTIVFSLRAVVSPGLSGPLRCYASVEEGAYGEYQVQWTPAPGQTCAAGTTQLTKGINEGIINQAQDPETGWTEICKSATGSGATNLSVWANPANATAWGQETLCN